MKPKNEIDIITIYWCRELLGDNSGAVKRGCKNLDFSFLGFLEKP